MNQGIGSALLDWVNEEAIRQGVTKISVSAWIGFRGINLYERNGFEQVATKEDAEYERYFGVPGRVLLVKEVKRPQGSP